jgi:hypothetical protein
MFVRTFLLLIIVAAVMLSLGWVGCSNNRTTTTTITDSYSYAGTISYYFPVSEGQVSTYQVRNADGSTDLVNLQVGPKMELNGQAASIWLSSKNGSNVDTSYSVVTESAVYFYDNARSEPELVLQLPLQPGRAWSRFGYTSIVTGGETTDTTSNPYNDLLYPKDTASTLPDTTQGGYTAKVYPTEGADVITVDKVEMISLSNGNVYSASVRVSNTATDGTTNYYWYVPGIGLTKYVIGATSLYPNGQRIGELVSYHR